MDNKRLLEVYTAELADRAVRLQVHLKAIEMEFYAENPSTVAERAPHEKPIFINSFRQCTLKILEICRVLAKKCDESLDDCSCLGAMHIARHGFMSLSRLHEEGLLHLPRPSEPVELRRFCRLISKHVLRRDVAVYVTETVPEGAFAADPLGRIKCDDFSRLVDLVNVFSGSDEIKGLPVLDDESIHVTIARVDARNPVRWPSLLHEAGHRLLGSEGREPPLKEQFKNWAPQGVESLMTRLEIETEAWITELWCDLLAALLMGPSFFFSQFAAFIASPQCDGGSFRRYPPYSLRLRLILGFLRHQYPDLMDNSLMRKHAGECIELATYWDDHYGQSLSVKSGELVTVYNVIRAFFQEHFFSGLQTDADNFRKKVEGMAEYVHAIDESELVWMQGELAAGLPVPSKARGGAFLNEEPASVQEVLLAGWLDRLERLRASTLGKLKEMRRPIDQDSVEEEVVPDVDRFDEAILRSLQLGEWLHLFASSRSDSKANVPKTDPDTVKERRSSVLVDREIVGLLNAGIMRVIPIVDICEQVGSASLDIRLGTSFEIFLPACRRGSAYERGNGDAYHSKRIDLDFLEYIVLMPGQFVLGHSFEYLKLPDWVAAELDGRSSYARLGLEIHVTAGMVDPGFEGVLTFELLNNGPNPIALYPGVRIGQIRFHVVEVPYASYSKRHTAKYRGLLQHNTSLYMKDHEIQVIMHAIEDLSLVRKGRAKKGKEESR